MADHRKLTDHKVLGTRVSLVAALSLVAIAAFAMSFMPSKGNGKIKQYKVKVEQGYRHDLSAYTQGLFIYKDKMYESTGQYGASTFREVDLESGKILREVRFPSQYFIEGSCVFDGRVYILTWYAQKCFVYDIVSFDKLAELNYKGEGWGLTTDGINLIMSDGSSRLTFRDPMTFAERKSVVVKANGAEVQYLNELEYIDGKVWANVYGQDFIVIIDPETGNVEERVNCNSLLESKYRTKSVDVLNGIACDPSDNSLYLTGKYWPRLYKVSLEEITK